MPWPLTPAPELLAQVQKAMGAQSALRTRETVTSGFGTPPAHTFTRTGQEYLHNQPWAAGGATDAVVTPDPGGRTLRFALPARGYHFAFRLDENSRVISEHIVTGNHQLERTHSYPAPSPRGPTSTRISAPTKESRRHPHRPAHLRTRHRTTAHLDDARPLGRLMPVLEGTASPSS